MGSPVGTGVHAHISVHNVQGPPKPPGADESRAPTLTSTERSFLQGLVSHMPAMCALTLPTPPSYARTVNGVWACGEYASWGTENRDAPIRLTGSKGSHHFEIRSIDGTASPYLVLAAIIAAGTLGILQEEPLVVGDCPRGVGALSEEQKKELNVADAKKLPRNIAEARDELAADIKLTEALGKDFVSQYFQVNKVRNNSQIEAGNY